MEYTFNLCPCSCCVNGEPKLIAQDDDLSPIKMTHCNFFNHDVGDFSFCSYGKWKDQEI